MNPAVESTMTVLQSSGLPSTPVGQLLVFLVVAAVIIALGRVALKIAWTIIVFAVVVVGVLWIATAFGSLL